MLNRENIEEKFSFEIIIFLTKYDTRRNLKKNLNGLPCCNAMTPVFLEQTDIQFVSS